MKALWLVSFRPIGKSKINDTYQSIFVDSVKSLDADITFSLTQFDEQNVKKFIDNKTKTVNISNLPIIIVNERIHLAPLFKEK